MTARTSLPRKAILVLMIVGAALYAALGWKSLTPETSDSKPGDLGAPVISGRRLPALVAASVQDAKTRAALAPLIAEAGGASCVVIKRNSISMATARADTSLIPASTAKLLTASAAIKVLGADKRFKTRVRASSVKNGVVDGPLYLVGGGDPLLFTSDYQKSLADQRERESSGQKAGDWHTSLESLADSVVSAGIRTINGGVSADDRIFDGERSIPTWDPGYIAQAQVGSIGALTVNQGIELRPARTVVGDPATHAAAVLTDLLKARGVKVAVGPGLGLAPDKAEEIAQVESLPVSKVVEQMLVESDNTTAEVLLKHIARDKTKRGETASGTPVVTDVLERPDTTLVDGSGLDRRNRTSCETLATVLARDGDNGMVSRGLPRAGKSGTLAKRMSNTPAVDRVQAKTGTLGGVSALAGWARPDGSSPLAFAMIVNGMDARIAERIQDRIAVHLATLPPVGSSVAYAPQGAVGK